MSNNLKLEAQISATSKGLVDALKHASGAVNETTQNWKNRFTALKDSTGIISQSIKNLSELIGDVGKVDLDVEGVDKVRSSIAEVSMSFQQVQGQIDAFTQKLVGMRNEASELGMPLEDFQRFSEAVQESGVSMEEAKQAIESMRKNIGDLANGVPEAQERFKNLGLSIEQLSGNSVVGNFAEITKAIQATYPASEQAKSGMEMFTVSMERALNVAQEYNKLLISQTDNAYATDKDVQSAISLSNAIGKLGEQLVTFQQRADGAKGATKEIENRTQLQIVTLNNAMDAQKKYNDSLDSVIGKLSSLKSAFEMSRDSVASWKTDVFDLSKVANGDIDGGIKNSLVRLHDLLDDESKKIAQIMVLQSKIGAPIDTQYVETYKKHIEELLELYKTIGVQIDKGIGDAFWGSGEGAGERLQNLRDTGEMVAEAMDLLQGKVLSADAVLENFKQHNEDYQIRIDLSDAQKSVSDMEQELDRLSNALERNPSIKINTVELDKAKAKLDEISSRDWSLKIDNKGIREYNGKVDSLKGKVDDLKQKINELNSIAYKSDRNILERLWDGAKGLGNALASPIRSIRQFGSAVGKVATSVGKGLWTGIKNVGLAFVHPINQVRKLKSHIDDVVASTHKVKGAANSAGEGFGRMAGRLAGMLFGVGSQLSIIAKGLKTIGSAITYYLIDPIRKAYKETKRLADLDYENDKKAFDTGRSRYERRLDDLKKLYSMISEAEAQGITDEIRVKMRQMQRMLSAEGVDIDLNFSSRKAKSQIVEAMKDASKRAIDYYESELASTIRHTKELRTAYAQSRSYGAQIGDFSHKESLAETWQSLLQDIDKSQAREFELRDTIRRLKAEQDASQFIREDAAKARDRAAQALKKASKDLEDWADQLDMTEYQQKLKEVMGKIDEMLKSGKDWTEIMPVARRQVEALIQEKFRKENDARQKLVDALQQSTEAYDRARQQRSQSARAVEQADKAYADAQRRAALDAQRERLAAKRESLQRRMGQYGFSPYSGFRINESERSRRRRRRNARLDEGIAEKLQRGEEGRKVSWTRAERRRLRSYQRLQRQDEGIARRQKEMDAAERQRSAAVSLESASQSLRDAIANWKAASAEEQKMFTEMEARRVDVENAQVPVLEDLDDTMQELLAWLRRQNDKERPPTRAERRREEIRQARERRGDDRRRFLEGRKPNESVVMDPYAKKEPQQNTGAGEAQPKTQKVVVYPIRNDSLGGQMLSPWDSYDPKTGKPHAETIEIPVGAIDNATKAVEHLTDVIDTVPGIAFKGENSPVENYGRALELLHRDMQEIASKTFRVV